MLSGVSLFKLSLKIKTKSGFGEGSYLAVGNGNVLWMYGIAFESSLILENGIKHYVTV